MGELVRTTDLHRHFRLGDTVVRAADGIDVTVAEGEFLSIMGPSGCGDGRSASCSRRSTWSRTSPSSRTSSSRACWTAGPVPAAGPWSCWRSWAVALVAVASVATSAAAGAIPALLAQRVPASVALAAE